MKIPKNKQPILTLCAAALLCCGALNSYAQAQEVARPVIQQVHFPTDTLQITEFGAQPNGQYLNTQAINQAISKASEQGGGVVLVPGGLWLTGPIELKSNVNLHLERDAVILFTDDMDAYQLIETNWEGQPAWRNQHPISGKNLENIAITGSGLIDGNGGAWRMVKRSKMTDGQWKKLLASGGVVDEKNQIWYPSESSFRGAQINDAGKGNETAGDLHEIKDFLRPNMVSITSSKRILLEGVTFQNSPAWNIHPLMCEDLTVRNLQVRNPWYSQNGDGLDIESCKNVLVENSTFDVGDDAICIKSGKDKFGRERGMPTENVIIRNNIVFHGHGGFTIGSEMSGGARNIWVEDCSFMGTDIGLRFKTTRGRGGVVENIFIRNINMVDIPAEAILFDMYYGMKGPLPQVGKQGDAIAAIPEVSEETPRFQNFEIKDIKVHGAGKAIFFRGLPEMAIKNIHIQGADLNADKGIELMAASGIVLEDIRLNTKEDAPLVLVDNSQNITLHKLQTAAPVNQLIHLSGTKTSNVQLKDSNKVKVQKIATFDQGASEQALLVE